MREVQLLIAKLHSVVLLLHYYDMNSKHAESYSKTIGWFVQVAKLGDWVYEVLLVISVLIQYRIIITVAILIAVDTINVSLNKVYFLENIANAINYFAIYSISNWNVNSKYNILNNKIKYQVFGLLRDCFTKIYCIRI